MAWPASAGGAGGAVATKTGCRVHATLNTVTCQVIATVLHAAVIFGLIFQGGLQFDPAVAIAAKALLVAKRANPVVLIGGHTVGIGKQRSVVVAFKVDRFFLEPMTFGAKFPSFSQFVDFGMGGWHPVTVACGTGHQEQRYKHKDTDDFHLELPQKACMFSVPEERPKLLSRR